ncbi:class E sortase [Streptomyces sp. ISL-10]|uniref:class E sortase n=1 Tax=Streptomyces sp. ISL-10 TaxID=2819172 RepID=UPI001BE9877D|nr:class E sortase [Streptomyces sp. ISL-10]MBT2367020.1 class E sortase [Streptomyces sp. ISL-10]
MRSGQRNGHRTRRGRARAALARGLWAAAEVTVTLGVIVLLLVVHQLWWTNRQAREGAERTVHALERTWGTERMAADDVTPGIPDERGERTVAPAAPRPVPPRWDQAYAVLRIPRLGVVAPVAQGIGRRGVLDKGYIGHYPGTAQPGQAGNFPVAGHRNTRGEPFRYINRLRSGDTVRIETREEIFVYAVDKTLTQTTPRDTGVIAPVPRSLVWPTAGYGEPGRYLTMTTCTPEFSSRYRLVVWARLASVQPR